jgi:hypothetical protein
VMIFYHLPRLNRRWRFLQPITCTPEKSKYIDLFKISISKKKSYTSLKFSLRFIRDILYSEQMLEHDSM